jgi:hypothetical protein
MLDICFSSSLVTGASNLWRSTFKTQSFSLYSHASYSPAHKNLRMLHQTCKGMSIRFVASVLPSAKNTIMRLKIFWNKWT